MSHDAQICESPAEPRETGRVKRFRADQGYGFITRANGEQLFVHFSKVLMKGYKTLAEGSMVEFSVRLTEKGLEAFDVVTCS
jgi:CspA family cold shock protein